MVAVIFDFDGVIADSETLANRVLARAITELGHPTSLDEAVADYCGKSFVDVIGAIEDRTGRPVPTDFAATLFENSLAAFRKDLVEVPGATWFIESIAAIPSCIASSSHPRRLEVCVRRLGLERFFEERLFSATMVERGKPAPDLFLFAARRLGTEPEKCIVIEDSTSGVIAGKAAGMHVIGLTAASHLSAGQRDVLRSAGADEIAASWEEAATIFTAWQASQAATSLTNSG